MRIRGLGAMIVALMLLAHAAGQDDELKKELARIKGSWEITEFVVDGRAIPLEEIKGARLVFTADRMTFVNPQGPRVFAYKLDISKTPRVLETTAVEGDFKDKTNPGIYLIEGDVIKVCVPNQAMKDPPKEFKSVKGSNVVLFTGKRLKE